MSADLSRLADVLEAFPRQSIAVLGDLVADEFVFGEISRVSREAPVLILRHRQTELLPGGGANAAANLAALGARVRLVGAVGDDAPGRALLEWFAARGVDTSGVVTARGWATTTKTRFLAGWSHTTRQQVLRVDREPGRELAPRVHRTLARRARRAARGAAAVLISDYGCGAVTPALARAVRGAPMTLDSRYRLLEYRGCGVRAATPNEAELEALYHTPIGADTRTLERLAARTLRALGLEALVVTRGKEGMAVFERRRRAEYIPIYGSDQVADVTGAGDTVIAVFTLALAAGASYAEAATLANFAGGIVVMKRGTATVSRAELAAAVAGAATGDRAAGSGPRP